MLMRIKPPGRIPDDEGGPAGGQQQEEHGDARQDVGDLAVRLRRARHDAADVLSQRAWSGATLPLISFLALVQP